MHMIQTEKVGGSEDTGDGGLVAKIPARRHGGVARTLRLAAFLHVGGKGCVPSPTQVWTRGWVVSAMSAKALGPPWPYPLPATRGPIVCPLHSHSGAHLAAMLSALLRPGMPHSRR